jgi:Cytochrome c oxidase subunit IV
VSEESTGKKRPKQQRQRAASSEVLEQTLTSQQSVWPLALALAMVVVLIGVIVHPIILGIGVVLVAVTIIGWGLQRS